MSTVYVGAIRQHHEDDGELRLRVWKDGEVVHDCPAEQDGMYWKAIFSPPLPPRPDGYYITEFYEVS